MSGVPFLIRPEQVRPYTIRGDESLYESRALIAPDGAGSEDLLVNHFTLRAGRALAPHVHPDNDELYYLLHGTGFIEVGGYEGRFDLVRYNVSPNCAVFIPAGTFHSLHNECEEDMTLLTIWPRLPEQGSNPVYDGRLATWGCTFRTVGAVAAS